MNSPFFYNEDSFEQLEQPDAEFFPSMPMCPTQSFLLPAKTPFSFYPDQEPYYQPFEDISPQENNNLANTIPEMDLEPEEMKDFEDFGFIEETPQIQHQIYHTTPIPAQIANTSQNQPKTNQNTLPSKHLSLAVRNLKSNFGTGLIQFLEFCQDRAEFSHDEKEAKICAKLLSFLRGRQSSFVSFAGWKDLFQDKSLGKLLRKKAKHFFGKSFARTYVQFGKIREEYKPVYYRKIRCFFEGSKNPELLNPARFNKY